ncbi:murein hydrolase activator EnvC family protein [Camelimonas abortus]|uniref:Murein hydrolase activator EnvC family protein n=1 Tax=Camelimonas abortus TaxID=1017184 RepID=A0ABV7LFS4_9HYPH
MPRVSLKASAPSATGAPRRRPPRGALLALAAGCACWSLAPGALGQQPAQQAAQTEKNRAESEKEAREAELKAIESRLMSSEEARIRLEAEIAALKLDRARLNGALLNTTSKVQATEERIAELESRLATLNDSADAIRRSFESRQDVIAEVLAALQRMGRKPPPAVLSSPDDMLAAVRTSMLLGAVVPELRNETRALATDLAELARLGDAIKADRQRLFAEMETIVEERRRLMALIEARQARLAGAERETSEQAARAAELAKQADDLKSLIARLESELATARRNTEAARKAEAELKNAKEQLAALAFRDPARLEPKIAFADARGQLPLPVGGREIVSFGQPDATGAKSQGITIATQPGAIVSAPADGWVSFAGPFRSFGQLLIINAGGGYYVLLAGMERINVSLGQFVLAGEPVAVMGSGADSGSGGGPAATARGRADAPAGPALYVEFRKDGGAIDPTPWWAKSPGASQGEKVRG